MDIVVAITLFILALLIGVEVIGKVPATLHTPLMSGANSIPVSYTHLTLPTICSV